MARVDGASSLLKQGRPRHAACRSCNALELQHSRPVDKCESLVRDLCATRPVLISTPVTCRAVPQLVPRCLQGLNLLHGAKFQCFSELKISNSRISCTLNGVRRSLLKVVWVTKCSYDSETSIRGQIFCSCSWQTI